MEIVHIAAELAPIAKVGGLADVVLGLSRQLNKIGHRARVIIPKYDCIDLLQVEDLVEGETFSTVFAGESYENRAWYGNCLGLPVIFIESKHPHAFYERGQIYACHDDMERFLYFSKAALDYLAACEKKPDIIHIHDWQTAAIAPLFRELYDLKLPHTRLFLTLHNMAYQGQCEVEQLSALGFDAAAYMHPDKMQDHTDRGKLNLLKGGIVYSDFITTVSPTYAEEVTSWLGGKGLDGVIIMNRHKFRGILNGLDYDFWNPETDPFLPAHYSLEHYSFESGGRYSLANKHIVKAALQERLGLAKDDLRPLVGVVTRLVPQKGIHLIRHALFRSLELGGQFVLLGSSPIPSIQEEFQALQAQFNDHPHARIVMVHDEEIAHLIFSGSDIILVPSLFEPCGLTQIIALRYGTVPVVRRTGGLADTVEDIDYSSKPMEQRNGYSFEHTDENALDSALDRAVQCWKHHPEVWWKLVHQGMKCDFSWEQSALQYAELYGEIAAKEGVS